MWLILSLLGCHGCSPPGDAPTSLVGQDPDVVVVLVGAIRADHMSLYGYERPTTPRIDAWADDRAVVFDAAHAQAPWSRPSVATLLTGTMPSEHGLQVPGKPPGAGTAPLQVVLDRYGYATAAVVSSVELRPGNNPFLRGFDTFREVIDEAAAKERHDISSPRVTEAAVALWTEHHAQERPSPMLLVVQYDDASPAWAQHAEPTFGDTPLDRYDSEIAFVDRHIGELLDAVGDQALVVLVGDHGTAIGESGPDRKALSLREEMVHVPLVMKLPGLVGARIERPVGLVDVAPSILAWVGAGVPKHMTGSPWAVTPFGNVELPRKPVRMEVRHLADARAVLDGKLKLVEDRSTGELALYDLKSDPHEATNRIDDPELRADLEKLRRKLDEATR